MAQNKFKSYICNVKNLIPQPKTYNSYICQMHVDDALIDKLSRLAMLQFNDAEREEIKNDLEKMIAFVDKLKELDTTGIEPLLHMTPNTSILREDIPGNMLTQQQALQNAPNHDKRFIKVPKVIKKPGEQ